MGLFNFNRAKKAEPTPTPSTPWDNLGQAVPFAYGGERPAEDPAARIKRQGDKIIACFMSGDPRLLGIKEVEVSNADRDQFYEALRNDRITNAHKSYLLQQINLPAGQPGHEDFTKTFQKIDSKHGRTILAFAGNFGLNNIAALNKDALASFLQAYPTPIEFGPRGEALISMLREAGNAPTKVAEYEEDLEKFQQDIYGKRYEYAKVLEVLEDEATKRAIQQQTSTYQNDISTLQQPIDMPGRDTNYDAPERHNY